MTAEPVMRPLRWTAECAAGLSLLALVGVVGVLAGLATAHVPAAGPGPCEVQANRPAEAPTLSAEDERIFTRLRDRIDRRVEEKVVESLEAAADDAPRAGADGKKSAGGALVAAAIAKVVYKAVRAAFRVLIVGAVADLFWTYAHYIVPAFLLVVTLAATPAGWAAGRRAARGVPPCSSQTPPTPTP